MWAGWREKGAEYVLRVFAQPAATDSSKTELVGEAYLTPTAAQAAAQKRAGADPSGNAMAEVKPSFRGVVATATTEVRAASHRLVDLMLGALTFGPSHISLSVILTTSGIVTAVPLCGISDGVTSVTTGWGVPVSTAIGSAPAELEISTERPW